MKLLIASDIHGSGYYTQKLVDAYHKESPDKLLILGDLLNHGPRNPMPRDFDNPKVIELLNQLKSEIICVRGNCDSEVDDLVFEFPLTSTYTTILYEKQVLFATHGHTFNESNPPPLNPGDVLLNGHTHISVMEEKEAGWYYINPGSVSIPKGGTTYSYIMFEDGVFILKDLDGNEINKMTINVQGV